MGYPREAINYCLSILGNRNLDKVIYLGKNPPDPWGYRSSHSTTFSIQDIIDLNYGYYKSIFYDEVKEKLDFYLQKDIFNKNDFSIIVLKHSIGQEYILIYKDFETKSSAYDYCYNYLKNINSCLIVNVQNLD